MKGFRSFVVAMLTVAWTQAAGSGPYLPSGWRPQGPAFLLPGEINESPAVPLNPAQESIAAGSDALREYGPPKLQEVPQDITQQALPDEAAGPPFYIIRADFHEDIKESEGIEVTTEQETESEVTIGITESVVEINTENKLKPEGKSIKFDVTEAAGGDSESKIENAGDNSNIQSDDDTESKIEESIIRKSDYVESVKSDNVESQENNNNVTVVSQTEESDKIKSGNTESVEQNSQVESSELLRTNSEELKQNGESLNIDADEKKVSGVNNIAEALINSKEEIKIQQDQGDAGVKNLADTAGSTQPMPEGFLEYGPPGLKEYGPPPPSKVLENQPSTGNEVDTNEARRRRFSPKFKTTSSKKH